MLTSCGPSVRAPRWPVPYGLRRARGVLRRESVPPFGARMSFVSSYGVVREEQLGESTDSRRDFHGPRGEDIYRRDDRSISGTRARWRLRADPLVEGDARGVPFPVMSAPTADVVICGAGIAGVAAAYHLAVRRGVTDVVLVDERPPLSLTSDKSTECYRNWWPGPGDEMVALMNRSIDLLEELARESGNAFRMSRRGYLFVTADAERVPTFVRAAEEAAARGVGPARMHASLGSDYRPSPADGFEDQPTGTDVITDRTLVRRHFPYLAEDTVALLHARRCGWFSGQQLGMYPPQRARGKGVRLVEGCVERVEVAGGRVRGVAAATRGRERPLVLRICTYDVEPVEPTFPLEFDPAYGEIVLRGMSRMLPALAAYLPRLPRHVVDGGYYTKTRENRVLASPLPVEGAYVLGALSGYGLMASNGAAELLADYIVGRPLPRYAPPSRLDRYDDPAYRALLARWGDSGQL